VNWKSKMANTINLVWGPKCFKLFSSNHLTAILTGSKINMVPLHPKWMIFVSDEYHRI
jgi:hypothetical protein